MYEKFKLFCKVTTDASLFILTHEIKYKICKKGAEK